MLMSELLHCVDKVFPIMEQCSCPSFSIVLTKLFPIMEQCSCPSFSIFCCSGCSPIFDSAYIPNVQKNNLSQNGSLLSQKWSFWHWKNNEFTQEIFCFNMKLSLNLLLKGRNWRKPKPFGFLQLDFSSLKRKQDCWSKC
jgi:hypothetical protein